MSAHPLATEFPIGTTVYEYGASKLYVIGWLKNDPESLWASPIPPGEDRDLAWKLRGGIAAAHARFFREHFTGKVAA